MILEAPMTEWARRREPWQEAFARLMLAVPNPVQSQPSFWEEFVARCGGTDLPTLVGFPHLKMSTALLSLRAPLCESDGGKSTYYCLSSGNLVGVARRMGEARTCEVMAWLTRLMIP